MNGACGPSRAAHQAERSTAARCNRDLASAEQTIRARQRDLDAARRSPGPLAGRTRRTGGLRGLTRSGRDQHHTPAARVEFQDAAGRTRSTSTSTRPDADTNDLLASSRRRTASTGPTNGVTNASALDTSSTSYWAEAVLDAARDGHPAAYGNGRLASRPQTIIDQVETLAPGPPDHSRSPPPPPSRTPYEPWPT